MGKRKAPVATNQLQMYEVVVHLHLQAASELNADEIATQLINGKHDILGITIAPCTHTTRLICTACHGRGSIHYMTCQPCAGRGFVSPLAASVSAN